jgi:predicted dehydrogenase
MDGKLRIGIVGAGMMGCEHIRNIKLMPEAAVTALVDPVQSSLDMALATLEGAATGVRSYADVGAMLADGIVEAALIVSPNHTHRAVLEPLFGTGLHILCEKPLATTVADARWIVDKAASHKGVFWVGMEYRYMPPAARFVADVKAGRVGRLRMLAIREHRFPFLAKVGDWNRFNRNTGGTMVEKCCHFFDLMRLVTGSEAIRVYCSGAMDVNHQDERYGGEKPDIIDNSYTVVDFANGVRAMLDLCMFAEGSKEQEELTAVGDEAKLEAFIPGSDLVFSPRVPIWAPKKVEREKIGVDETALKAGTHHGATYYQMRAFLDAIASSGTPAVTAEDGLRAVEIGAAAELSAREKRVVTLAELR